MLVVFAAAACRRAEPLPDFGKVPDFVLTDETGQPFGTDQLRGKPWVANFVFTRCPTICPRFSAQMARIQAETRGTPVRLVSFSVDPEHDTPEVLAAYGEKYKREPGRWSFLTGRRGAVESLVKEGFKQVLEIPDGGDVLSLAHGSHFVLVDGQMRMRGFYSMTDAQSPSQVAERARQLLKE